MSEKSISVNFFLILKIKTVKRMNDQWPILIIKNYAHNL